MPALAFGRDKRALVRGKWRSLRYVEERMCCASCGPGTLVTRRQDDPEWPWVLVCRNDPEHEISWPPDPRIERIEKLYEGRMHEMPITDLAQTIRFQRLGKIRLGIKVEVINKRTGKPKLDKDGNPVMRPLATDYFVVPDEVKAAGYGDKPAALNIYFLFNDLDAVFPQFHKRYTRSNLWCMGDGERVVYLLDGGKERVVVNGVHVETGEIMPCPGLAHDLYPRCEQCKPTGRLLFAIQEIPRLGFWEMVARKLGIININSQLRLAQALTGGRLTNVPFILRLVPEVREVPMGEDGQLRKKTLYIPTVEIDPAWLAMALPKLQARAEREMLMIEAPRGDSAAPRPVAIEPEEVEDLDYEPNGDWEEDEAPVEGELAGEAPPPEPEFACAECGETITPFHANGKTYSVSQLIDVANNLGQPRPPTCGPCLQEIKQKMQAQKAAKEGTKAPEPAPPEGEAEPADASAPAEPELQEEPEAEPQSRTAQEDAEVLTWLERLEIRPDELPGLIGTDDSYEDWLLTTSFSRGQRVADLVAACDAKGTAVPDWLREEAVALDIELDVPETEQEQPEPETPTCKCGAVLADGDGWTAEQLLAMAEDDGLTLCAGCRGKQKPVPDGDGKTPTSPQKLLALVNEQFDESYYKHVTHLHSSLRQELGKGWRWPAAKDVEGWQSAYEAALSHVQKKDEEPESDEQPEPTGELVQEEMPL